MVGKGALLFSLLPTLMASPAQAVSPAEIEKATFAGGCFWCMVHPFEKLDGVLKVKSGYTGGHVKDPSYMEVVSGDTGHVEAVQVTFDPKRITYSQILDVFWRQIDPTDPGGQFVDRGSQYKTAIFYHSQKQRETAEKSRETLNGSGIYEKPIVTGIRPFEEFYEAEKYHQDYHLKNPMGYRQYRSGSGRDQYLREIWKGREKKTVSAAPKWNYEKKSPDELKKTLTPIQYKVTQQDGTEPPFNNPYWDNKEPGIYVDIVSGEPLFSSLDKYDSGTGWPSFTRPLAPENVVLKEDRSLFSVRTEVRSRHADSHLGHVFSDGPPPAGRRYCMNSASMRFIRKEDLEKEGYGQYKKLFETSTTASE